ncbi:rho GTPase-activating protein 26-like [Babylonia areolata]|uniref:rho GTPase-activating protein 26-like n=1 Tax=Babylonia areolata TaxID=304850 RepID=UPI003FD51F7A
MGLQPLEFADCLTDSPLFRAKLTEHERELERTSKAIKTLIQHGKQVFEAAKQLSRAQKAFAKDLKEFNFECIDQQTDDERTIGKSLAEFSKYISIIEEQRERMFESCEDEFVQRLETFRKVHLGEVKEGKKNFDKETSKFCLSQERYLNIKAKISDSQLKEADAQVDMEKRGFYQASMKYVLKLQEAQEKKKFEFVEILLGYMWGWLSFYHQGYDSFEEFKQYDTYLRFLLQKTRENFERTREQAEKLMSKMLETRGTKPMDQSSTLKGFTRQGYLYLLEKKALSTTWTKYYCQYKKDTKEFYMILYNQIGGKVSEPEQLTLDSCIRRASETIERRFCFDITVKERQGTMTFQALSEDDRRLWLDAMDGREPTYLLPNVKTDDTMLDETGFNFMRKAIAALENRGLHEQGLYRMVGVNSKVANLLKTVLDPKKADKVSFDEPAQWETKTITSAIKNYLRSLPEPLMTFKLHDQFIKAAKQESKTLRKLDVHKYCYLLPKANFEMLELLIGHLKRVSDRSDENKMTVANLGVCFGPSLMRPEEETMAAIMDIKFCNIIVELLINNYDEIFSHPPDETEAPDPKGRMAASQPPESAYTSPIDRYGVCENHTAMQTRPSSSVSSFGSEGASHQGSSPSWGTPSRSYGGHGSSARGGKPRPIQVYNPSTGGVELLGSTSSSTESLNSSSSKAGFSPRTGPSTPSSASSYGGGAGSATPDGFRRPSYDMPTYANVSALASRFNASFGSMDSPQFGSVKKRTSSDYTGSSMNSSVPNSSSLTGSHASLTGSGSKGNRRTVITRYACRASHKSELSFEANQMIHNVRPSLEPGWLEGEIDGKVGLIPANYVEFLDS